jgi:hypothetical protein
MEFGKHIPFTEKWRRDRTEQAELASASSEQMYQLWNQDHNTIENVGWIDGIDDFADATKINTEFDETIARMEQIGRSGKLIVELCPGGRLQVRMPKNLSAIEHPGNFVIIE